MYTPQITNKQLETGRSINDTAVDKITETSDVLSNLYSAADKIAPLSKEEKTALALKAQQGDKAAKELLIMAHIKLVMQIALKKYKQTYTVPIKISMEDLVMAGICGVDQAIYSFNSTHDKDASFTTYAMYAINKEINEEYLNARPIKITGHIMERTIMMKKVSDKLQELLGHTPTDKELYDYFDGAYPLETIKETNDLIKNTGTISLFERFGQLDSGEDDGTLIGAIANEDSPIPEEICMRNNRRAIIENALANIPARESAVIKLIYGLTRTGYTYTLEQIARIIAKLGYKNKTGTIMTKESVRLIKNQALIKLKRLLEDSKDLLYN